MANPTKTSRESAQYQTRLTVAAEKWATGEWTDAQARAFVATGRAVR